VGILTIDFITPIVDDPVLFGEVAAANSLSDVFAKGGRPRVALNVVAFPLSCEPIEVLQSILQGGQKKVIEAGAILAGGHSVEDREPKYGLVVFGEARRDDIWRIDGAEEGDVLILTKPLGTGLISTAAKADMAKVEHISAAVESMRRLNDLPLKLDANAKSRIHACTDVTGFGLAGHLLNMLSSKDLSAEICIKRLPVIPGALEYAEEGLVPGGGYRNRKLYTPKIGGLDGISSAEAELLFDPQTSGGLLLAVHPEGSEMILAACRASGWHNAAVIGRFIRGDGEIAVKA
jgi:selenide,water dikinase